VFAELGGNASDALRGRTLEGAVPDLAPRLTPLLRQTLSGGSAELEVETDTQDQRRSWRVTAFPVRSRELEPLGAGLLLLDDTDRQTAEEERARLFHAAQEAVQVREDFLSIASHELKTPLTPIFARLGFLKRRLAAGEAISAESIDKALQGLRKLTELINDLLDASRIQYGRLMLHKTAQPQGDVVLKGEEPNRRESPEHALAIDLPSEPLWAEIDTQRLTQVVTNLVDNAIKYSPAGGRIEVRLRPHPEGLELTVRDRGIGLSAAQKERLFERFYRVATGTVSSGGLGLGLYISRDIVERHGGRIWVESELGKGACFHVVLPRIAPAELPDALH
jgi:signal transduction histidine kinase